ncbi:ABC transporter permease [Siminovitchia fortis]|uniref:Transport permease protein n=1 Tax=Siminovitchia fortis TaxID=254758 RepID=A0A443IJU1_9BACI|nr:ABC transporter permease [Siminovitchia fortis]RWR04948.1 ABC transporter permease [Siminovitchia fortis]WHY80623.1 ABC transporter permease [Siminovitchia fortis]
MNKIVKLSVMETKLFFREKMAVFWTFLFPVLMIWLFGAMFGSAKIGGMTYSNAYIPSWIAVNILTTAFFGIGTVMANYREKGILRRYQVTTVRPWMVLTAQTVQGTVIFTISAVIILIFGFLVFDLHVPKYLGSTLLAILLSLVAFFPFGLLINSIAKSVRTASAISSLAMNLMIFLSGATFPIEWMPNVLRVIAHILPLYYVIDLIRQTWNFTPIWENGVDVAVLLGVAIVSIILSSRFFRWSGE